MLRDLIRLENRPRCLTELAYEWCSVICEDQSSEDWESLLLDSLEIGFRHLDSRRRRIVWLHLAHTEHHRGLADAVFKSKKSEAIADLLHAWMVRGWSHGLADTLLGTCTGHLIDLHDLMPFSLRLRRLVIRSVGLIGYKKFEEVGVEGFVELLNHLCIGVEDVEDSFKWISLLLDAIQSPHGTRHLSDQSWKLLVELTVSKSEEVIHATYAPQVM